jgi:hypothetical protein
MVPFLTLTAYEGKTFKSKVLEGSGWIEICEREKMLPIFRFFEA